jgi:hypothetical protein
MLTPDATLAVQLVFADRGEGQSKPAFRLPFLTSVADANAIMTAVTADMLPLSDAVLIGVKFVWSWHDTDYSPPPIGATTQIKLALFYRSDERYEAIHIPAPKESLFETEGPYAGIRLNIADGAVATLIDNLTTSLSEVVDETGEAFPTTFLVGGKVL